MTVLDARACAHPRVEPVTLLTGETVAAVCAGCLARLPAAWLECVAAGGHDAAFEVTGFDSPVPEWGCGRCGGIYAGTLGLGE